MKRTAEEQKAIDLQRKSLVIRALLRGKPRSEVAERFQLSEAEVFRIEEDYYSSQESLSEHAQLMKHLARLEKLLDALWDSVVGKPLATNPDNVKTALATIEAVSDLAGLKKTKSMQRSNLFSNSRFRTSAPLSSPFRTTWSSICSPFLQNGGRSSSKRTGRSGSLMLHPVRPASWRSPRLI